MSFLGGYGQRSSLSAVSDLEWGPDEGVMTWHEAVALAKSKGDGWRLPTIAELQSQFDYDAGKPKKRSWKRDYYWSSSVNSGNTANAWSVDFDNGHTNYYFVSFTNRVRCVR